MHQKHDSFRTLKYIGYCLSQLPPDPKTRSYEDYVNHAKYRLSVERGLLLKDPIWEKYTDEEVLIEHFALIFDKDKEERARFLSGIEFLAESIDDFDAWANKMIEKNAEDLSKVADGLDEKITFNPKTLGE